MIQKTSVKAIIFHELGELRCGNCGKKLLEFEKKTPKKPKNSRKDIDNFDNLCIMSVKVLCDRCKAVNETDFNA